MTGCEKKSERKKIYIYIILFFITNGVAATSREVYNVNAILSIFLPNNKKKQEEKEKKRKNKEERPLIKIKY